MAQKGIHVVPDGRGWAVRRAGASRASGLFETQKEAVRVARDKARSEAGELYIHGTDGRIRERSTFAADRFPPKG